MEAKDTVMVKDSIEEVKYLETRDNPEYHYLRLQEKRDVEDKAIARRQAEITWDKAKEYFPAQGRKEVAIELFEDVICPMCYRLNPQHTSMNNGAGCKSCQDKEDYCGALSLQSGG